MDYLLKIQHISQHAGCATQILPKTSIIISLFSLILSLEADDYTF